MKAKIIAATSAVVLVLGAGAANAAFVGSGANPGYPQTQQQLRTMPGYSVGTGNARVGDGSDPGYLNTRRQLQNMPGYYVGR